MEITSLYQESCHIRVKNSKEYKKLGPAKSYNRNLVISFMNIFTVPHFHVHTHVLVIVYNNNNNLYLYSA